MLKIVGDRIRKARENAGISQKKLGLMLGLSDKAISAYESGRTFPPLDTLYRISQELEKDITYFVTNNEECINTTDAVGRIEKSLSKVVVELEALKKSLPKSQN